MKSLTQAFFEAINGLNIKENELIILGSKCPIYCYGFALHVTGANKQALSEVVLKSLNYHYINLFYNNIDFDKSRYDLMLLFK